MTVYVDDFYKRPQARFGRLKMSHMVSNNLDELHAMAEAIGLKRTWFQEEGSYPHYDICLAKRRLAIEKGALFIPCRNLILLIRQWRLEDKCLKSQ